MSHITVSQFTTRFISLVLKGNGLPRKQLDCHILLMSAVLGLEAGRKYSEKQLNDELGSWSTRFGDNVCLDHVSLRRLLVDDGYLTRDAAGTTYVLKTEGWPHTIDPAIRSLDLQGLIDEAIRDNEERRSLRQREGGQ